MPTEIAWTDETWNPVVGCTPISQGCRHCYAERVAHRGLQDAHRGLTRNGRWTGEVRLLPERLERPLRWRKPRRIFVCSTSDLFHEHVPDSFLDQVFGMMAACQQHTFQVLTKRPDRMFHYYMEDVDSRARILEDEGDREQAYAAEIEVCLWLLADLIDDADHWSIECARRLNGTAVPWPLPNVHLGVTAEDQPALLDHHHRHRLEQHDPRIR